MYAIAKHFLLCWHGDDYYSTLIMLKLHCHIGQLPIAVLNHMNIISLVILLVRHVKKHNLYCSLNSVSSISCLNLQSLMVIFHFQWKSTQKPSVCPSAFLAH